MPPLATVSHSLDVLWEELVAGRKVIVKTKKVWLSY
jgi:hypothetical protein